MEDFELKPCPLCGCDNIRWRRNSEEVRLYCTNCKLGFINRSSQYLPFEEQMNILEIMEIKWNDRLRVVRETD